MKIGLGFSGATPLPQTLPAVLEIERSGLDSIWSAEHVGLNDAIVPSTAYAMSTRRIEIGMMGFNLDTRHPGVLAMELATLASIAPDRLRIQIGTGSPSRARYLGCRSRRGVADVGDLLEALRGLLGGALVEMRSATFELDGMRLSGAASLPIDVMAIRPRMTRLAAQHGDGLSLSAGASRQYLRQRVEEVGRLLEEFGRDRSRFRISATVLAGAAPDVHTARDHLRRAVSAFPIGEVPELLAGIQVPDAAVLATVRANEGPAAASALFSDEAVDGMGLVITPSTVKQAVAAYRDTGIDELIVMPADSDIDVVAMVGMLATARGEDE